MVRAQAVAGGPLAGVNTLRHNAVELPPESWRLFNDGWIAFPVASV